MKYYVILMVLISTVHCTQKVLADDVKIVDAVVRQSGASYTFSVTLLHNDEGWKHYANLWEVWAEDGMTLLGKRVLAHPHVNEQPFTRSLSGVKVPHGTSRVMIRAYDLVHGEAKSTFMIDLPKFE